MKALSALLLFAVMAVVVALITALPVMWLLNWVISPAARLEVFGTTHVGFWQAYGFAILCSCLFTRVSTSSSK